MAETNDTRSVQIDTGALINNLYNIRALANMASAATLEENNDASRVMDTISGMALDLANQIDRASLAAAKGGAA